MEQDRTPDVFIHNQKLEGEAIGKFRSDCKFNSKYNNSKRLGNKSKADKNQYEKGLKIDDEALKKINLTSKEFRGDWNYKISP